MLDTIAESVVSDGTVVAAFIGLLGVLVSVIVGTRQKATSELIDDLTSELARLSARVAHLERRDRLLTDYISKLRRHINDGNPPPPPPWPPGLDG